MALSDSLERVKVLLMRVVVGIKSQEVIMTIDQPPGGIPQEKEENNPTTSMPEFARIHRALREGYALAAFTERNGRRAVILTTEKSPLAYAQHTHIEGALIILEEGSLTTETSIVATGSTTSSTYLDEWLQGGGSFQCWQQNDTIVFRLKLDGITKLPIPDGVRIAFLENVEIQSITWKDDHGFTFHTNRDHSSVGILKLLTQPLDSHPKRSSPVQPFTKTGVGNTFWTAVLAAIQAPELEILPS